MAEGSLAEFYIKSYIRIEYEQERITGNEERA